jgi:8-oxo-dGTP pyrophosphatase MutT (NUDIX family)
VVDARSGVRAAIRSVPPGDALEERHRGQALGWVDSGAPLFRVAPPAEPDPHLVSYAVAFDPAARAVLLGHHRKTGLWLPTGGHVEPGEGPAATAQREVREELGVSAPIVPGIGARPLFLSVTATVGAAGGHTDVSLWYVLLVDVARPLAWDRRELAAVRWFGLAEVLAADPARLDPCLHRFTRKLRAVMMSDDGECRGDEGEP